MSRVVPKLYYDIQSPRGAFLVMWATKSQEQALVAKEGLFENSKYRKIRDSKSCDTYNTCHQVKRT